MSHDDPDRAARVNNSGDATLEDARHLAAEVIALRAKFIGQEQEIRDLKAKLYDQPVQLRLSASELFGLNHEQIEDAIRFAEDRGWKIPLRPQAQDFAIDFAPGFQQAIEDGARIARGLVPLGLPPHIDSPCHSCGAARGEPCRLMCASSESHRLKKMIQTDRDPAPTVKGRRAITGTIAQIVDRIQLDRVANVRPDPFLSKVAERLSVCVGIRADDVITVHESGTGRIVLEGQA